MHRIYIGVCTLVASLERITSFALTISLSHHSTSSLVSSCSLHLMPEVTLHLDLELQWHIRRSDLDPDLDLHSSGSCILCTCCYWDRSLRIWSCSRDHNAVPMGSDRNSLEEDWTLQTDGTSFLELKMKNLIFWNNWMQILWVVVCVPLAAKVQNTKMCVTICSVNVWQNWCDQVYWEGVVNTLGKYNASIICTHSGFLYKLSIALAEPQSPTTWYFR